MKIKIKNKQDYIDFINDYQKRRIKYIPEYMEKETFEELLLTDQPEDIQALSLIFNLLMQVKDYSRYAPVTLEDNTMNGDDKVKNSWRIHFLDHMENEFFIEVKKQNNIYKGSIWKWNEPNTINMIEISINDVC